MSAIETPSPHRAADAIAAAAIFAIDPTGCGGVSLRALHGPVRDRWFELLTSLLPDVTRMHRIPLHVADGRLLGGLDLAATLRAGRPIAERGILATASGGLVVLAMAERLTTAVAARLAAVLDSGEVALQRDGFAMRCLTRFGVIALDEGMTPDERPPAAILDRLALHVDLHAITDAAELDGVHELATTFGRAEIAQARERLCSLQVASPVILALCETASALGIASIRAPLLALHVARVAAAFAGRSEVSDADAALAARLVFAARATMLPAPEAAADDNPTNSADADAEAPATEPSDGERLQQEEGEPKIEALNDVILAAAQAAIPKDLLSQLQLADPGKKSSHSAGRLGVLQASRVRGRPAGVCKGSPAGGSRLSIVETLRAAAPWQGMRRARAAGSRARRIQVRKDDFRVVRLKRRTQTTTIFLVDASGSAALHRLAEVKGAVELLLADCYVRRDRVALIAFRGRSAQLLLPPTRSLVRAKRCLASLAGGGGTPLALGLDAARALAHAVQHKGESPILVIMTDGRANVARDGASGRDKAQTDALSAARLLRIENFTALLVDTAPEPVPQAARLAAEMRARYLPLPHARAATLSEAVRKVALERSAHLQPTHA
jgi:magnesium chelatase subunit D